MYGAPIVYQSFSLSFRLTSIVSFLRRRMDLRNVVFGIMCWFFSFYGEYRSLNLSTWFLMFLAADFGTVLYSSLRNSHVSKDAGRMQHRYQIQIRSIW
ncbi:hypothetical protein K438DRAFT_566691 [Mycena galopus ATCC 62051]|nr:hypothetical protein K438DRAFT_566691 [Mycena galopus ATCC 62051]